MRNIIRIYFEVIDYKTLTSRCPDVLWFLPNLSCQAKYQLQHSWTELALIATLGSILDFQLSWESGKFRLARWSHGVVLFSPIFTYLHQFSPIFTFYHLFPSIFTYFHLFLHIFTYHNLYLPIVKTPTSTAVGFDTNMTLLHHPHHPAPAHLVSRAEYDMLPQLAS